MRFPLTREGVGHETGEVKVIFGASEGTPEEWGRGRVNLLQMLNSHPYLETAPWDFYYKIGTISLGQKGRIKLG